MSQALFDLNQYDPRLVDCTIFNGDIRALTPAAFPTRYAVGIADFPWSYDNQQSHDPRRGGYRYDPMTLEDIINACGLIEQVMLFDSLLYVWGTWPKIDQFIEVYTALRGYGYQVVTGLPWVKVDQTGNPRYLTGHWWAGCSEYCVLLRRGKVSPPDDVKPLGLLADEVLGHSRKPDGVHELAERSPGPWVEWFAREPRAGWTVMGNELGEWVGEVNGH